MKKCEYIIYANKYEKPGERSIFFHLNKLVTF